jgi:hypothetical protein
MQVFAQHLQTPPTPPSHRGPEDVPPELEQLVMTCLAKSPEDRPPSAADLERRLEAAAVEPWTEADAEQWWAALSPSGSLDASASGESVTRTAADFRETADAPTDSDR